ncbi:MAG: Fic family protein [Proteobacteria bacterium]|nr:Fic family protein [Pseudomonadota bacterium]
MIEIQDPRCIKLSGTNEQALAQVSYAMEKMNKRRPFDDGVSQHLRDALLPDRIVATLNMEGIVATRRQTIAVMDAMRVQETVGKSEIEIVNTLRADEFIQEAVDNGVTFDERLVRQINSVLLHTLRQDAGQFRLGDVELPGAPFSPPPPGDVPELIRKLVEVYPLGESVHPVLHAAWLHAQFTQIHPFSDGNGRTGRLLQDWTLIRRGYFPIGIPPSQRDDYYKALELADSGEWDEFVELLAVLQLSMLAKIEAVVGATERRQTFITKLATAAAAKDRNTRHRSYLVWRRRMELLSNTFEEACSELDRASNVVGATFRGFGVVEFRDWESICRYGSIDKSWLFSLIFFAEGHPFYKVIAYLRRHNPLPAVDDFSPPRDAVALYFTGTDLPDGDRPNFYLFSDPHIRVREVLFSEDGPIVYHQPTPSDNWKISRYSNDNQIVEELFLDIFVRKAGLHVDG